MDGRRDDLPPETHNSEQEEPDQAQDVADDAMILPTEPGEESEHGGHSDPTQVMPDDTPDLVDRMRGMVRSGHIDNDAFAGEPEHDDEENLGTDEDEDDESYEGYGSDDQDDGTR